MQEPLEKKWELSYLYDMTQQALEAGDVDKAVKLSKKGLEESELDVSIEWRSKFEEISQALTQQSSNIPVENETIPENKVYENLSKIKGVGPTYDEELELSIRESSTIQERIFNKEERENKKGKSLNAEVEQLPRKTEDVKEIITDVSIVLPEVQTIARHTQGESENIYEQIIKEVGFDDYYHIPEQIIQAKFLQEIDLILFKMYPFKEKHQILLIVPVKLAQIEDILITSESTIEYEQYTEQNFLVSSYVSHLINAQEVISEEVGIRGDLFQYMQKFLMTKMDVAQSQVIKNEITLFSGGQRISVYIDPIFISVNEVKFLEKSIPFAYQKTTNIHFVSISQLNELLEFLEHKHTYIEEYNGVEQIEDNYQYTNQEFQKKLIRYSLIPAGFGGLTIVIALTQMPPLLLPFIGLSYFMLAFYGVMLGYFFYKFKIKRKNIIDQLNIPSSQRPPELDDASLEIIYQELVDDLMLQFGYECFGKTSKYILLNRIEQQRAEQVLSTPISQSPTTSVEILFEPKENDDEYQEKIKQYFQK